MKTLTRDDQGRITPAQAIDLLRKGNERFVNQKMHDRDLLGQVTMTAGGQFPFAVVLSCIDSRVPAEIVFDQGVGDMFSCRVAGNVLNEDVLGSIEFACKVAGSKALVVLGHTKCGAVKGACDHVELGNLTALLKKIEPAVVAENETTENRNSSNIEFVDRVARLNVRHVIAEIRQKSPVLAEMIEHHEIAVIGGMYDVETGMVEFCEDTLSL
jgi:carbonic anhydrase